MPAPRCAAPILILSTGRALRHIVTGVDAIGMTIDPLCSIGGEEKKLMMRPCLCAIITRPTAVPNLAPTASTKSCTSCCEVDLRGHHLAAAAGATHLGSKIRQRLLAACTGCDVGAARGKRDADRTAEAAGRPREHNSLPGKVKRIAKRHQELLILISARSARSRA